MYCKNFWFSPKKVVWEFQKIPRFAENQAFCMGTRVLLDSARVCQNLTNGPNILKYSENTASIITNVFAIHFSYVCFNLQELWGLESDDLNITSRQNRRIEKVIIPIL